MSKRDVSLLLDDMLQSSLKIKRYTEGLVFESFAEDEKTIDAVVRNFEIIGEAANRIDEDFKSKHPQIEWKEFVGSGTELYMNILELTTILCGK